MKFKFEKTIIALACHISMNAYSDTGVNDSECLPGVYYGIEVVEGAKSISLSDYVALDQGKYIVLVKKGVMQVGESLLVKHKVKKVKSMNNEERKVPVGTFL